MSGYCDAAPGHEWHGPYHDHEYGFPLRGDGAPIRVEHWRVAQQHGRVAALNMLGRGVSYDAVPVFWTIQYLKRLDYVGHASEWDEIALHGDLRKPEFIAYYVKDGYVAAQKADGKPAGKHAAERPTDKTRPHA